MEFSSLSIIGSSPNLALIKLTASHVSFIFALLNILVLVFSHLLVRLISMLSSNLLLRLMINHEDDHDDDQIPRPSASLVPVPAYFFAESIKKQLPVMPYRSFLEKNRGDQVHDEDEDDDHKGCVCIVCLTRIEASHEVRVPFNCCHVFHRECLDVWVDQGQGTCPLCRSKLLPFQNHDHHDNRDNHDDHGSDHGQGGDPWRRERMIYLFGEDYLFGDE